MSSNTNIKKRNLSTSNKIKTKQVTINNNNNTNKKKNASPPPSTLLTTKKPLPSKVSTNDNKKTKNDNKKALSNKNKVNLLQYNSSELDPTNLTNQQIPLTSNSLVRYETPFLVSSTISNKKLLDELDENNETSEMFLKQIINGKEADCSPMKEDYSLKDALNKIIPPSKKKQGDQMWVKYVSCNPVTKAEVINLYQELDRRLENEKAREDGICPIREKLYKECFEEIIRQITINCLERGILLMRVKTEIDMTTNCYMELYESCVAYGLRISLTREREKRKWEDLICTREEECENLSKEIKEMEDLLKEKMENDEIEQKKIEEEHRRNMIKLKSRMKGYKEDIKLKFKNYKENN